MILFEILYLLVIAGLSGFGFHRLALLYMSRAGRAKGSDVRAERSPAIAPFVTIQLPLYNERHVASRLIDAVCQIEYDLDRLEIQVLDDSTDDSRKLIEERVIYWQRKGRSISVLRRSNRDGFKAGALAIGLDNSKGEYIAVFDADFVPQPDFLSALLKHFEDPNVGMVQARWSHLNRHESLLTEAQAVLLDGHFSVEQFARSRNGLWFNFNGTAGIWRRTCIVDAGGWSHDTLTEDLDLSYRAQMRGWKFAYNDALGVPAELPSTLDAFRTQQHRWAKGSIQVARKLLLSILRDDYPLSNKLEATCHLLANLNYLMVSCLCFLLPIILLMSPQRSVFVWFGGHLFLLGSLCFAGFYVVSQRTQQSLKRTITLLPLVFALGLSLCWNNSKAVLEAILGHASPFERTPKSGSLGEGNSISKPYKALSSISLKIFEHSLLALYVGATVVCMRQGAWEQLPILSLFITAFSAQYWSGANLRPAPHFRVRSLW